MKNDLTEGLLKISALSEASGVNVSTIKFYVKEGMIQPAVKTGPNMAYYSPDCVARIQLIRSLQKAHYYPLTVIKRLLDTHVADQMEMELLDAIHKADYKSISKTFQISDVIHVTHLTKKQIMRLVDAKLVDPEVSGKRLLFTESDLQIMLLIRRRMDAGIPFDQSVDTFAVYAEAITPAVRSDVDSFISRAILSQNLTAEDIVRMISVSDETLDKFIGLRRSALNRIFGSERVSALDSFALRLRAWLQTLAAVLGRLGLTELASRCEETPQSGNDGLSVGLRLYNQIITSGAESLSKSMAVSNQAHLFFSASDAAAASGPEQFLLACLRLGWLCLAPSLLDYDSLSKAAISEFPANATNYIGERAADTVPELVSALARIGGKT